MGIHSEEHLEILKNLPDTVLIGRLLLRRSRIILYLAASRGSMLVWGGNFYVKIMKENNYETGEVSRRAFLDSKVE